MCRVWFRNGGILLDSGLRRLVFKRECRRIVFIYGKCRLFSEGVRTAHKNEFIDVKIVIYWTISNGNFGNCRKFLCSPAPLLECCFGCLSLM